MIPLLFVPASRQKPLQVHVLYLSAVTGGTCRSLTVSDCCSHGSVRLSEAMFDLPLLLPSQPAKPEWFPGVFSVNLRMQMYSLRHCVLFLCTGFMLTHLHQFVNRKKPAVRGFFIFSPFGGPFIHRNNYLWFALITDIAASSATTVRSL